MTENDLDTRVARVGERAFYKRSLGKNPLEVKFPGEREDVPKSLKQFMEKIRRKFQEVRHGEE